MQKTPQEIRSMTDEDYSSWMLEQEKEAEAEAQKIADAKAEEEKNVGYTPANSLSLF